MIDKERTVKRALRMIGMNYTASNNNKRTVEEEAYDMFDDIIGDILANKNFTFNAKTITPTPAPSDKKLDNAGIIIKRYYIPSDYLNTIESNIEDLEIDGGYFTTRKAGGIVDYDSIIDTSIWIRYCFNGDHTLVPDYFARYVALTLAYELALVFKPSDMAKMNILMEEKGKELIAIDQAQMSNRPVRIDGSITERLNELRRR